MWWRWPAVSGGMLGQGARVAGVSGRGQAQSRVRLRLGDIGRLIAVWLVASAALALTDALLPNLTADAPWTYFAATAVAGLLGLVFRPVLVFLVARIGWVAVVIAGLVGQALLVYIAILIVPFEALAMESAHSLLAGTSGWAGGSQIEILRSTGLSCATAGNARRPTATDAKTSFFMSRSLRIVCTQNIPGL